MARSILMVQQCPYTQTALASIMKSQMLVRAQASSGVQTRQRIVLCGSLALSLRQITGEIFAVLSALRLVHTQRRLLIFTDSEHVICHACYGAAKNQEEGWCCSNGDLLKDMVFLLRSRLAPTYFLWVKAHDTNNGNEAADVLAKAGACEPLPPDYVNLTVPPWPVVFLDSAPLNLPKVFTPLAEFAMARPDSAYIVVDPLELQQDGHRGRSKVRRVQADRLEELRRCDNNAGAFWKLIRSWTDTKRRDPEVSLDDLAADFEKHMNYPALLPLAFDAHQLAYNKTLADLLPLHGMDTTPTLCLSQPISMSDMEWSRHHIVTYTIKSVGGWDAFPYIACLKLSNEVVMFMFNECDKTGTIPSLWLCSLLAAILKHGKPGTLPESYRSVAMKCALLKWKMLIADRRFREAAEVRGLISQSQNGFREGFRTNNNPFIMQCLIEKADSMGKPLFVGLIDLKNAFPATDRPTLWVKLQGMGISGPLVDWVKMLYERLTYHVRQGQELSDEFKSFLEILAGDPASPHLWNLFLSDFRLDWHPDDVTLNGIPVPKCEHADDVMINSSSPAGFQAKLTEMAGYCSCNGCEISATKSVFLLFGQWKGKQPVPQFLMGNKEVKQVYNHPYVGQWFQSDHKCMFAEHYSVKAAKANVMANACLGVSRMVGTLPAWDGWTLYMLRIDPYLTSGCDICPDIVQSQLHVLEDIQYSYLRQMLGIGNQSSLVVLFTETGIWPIHYR